MAKKITNAINGADITPLGLHDVLDRVLTLGHTPSRKYRIWRVYWDNRPLWLDKNRTTFRTRPSLDYALHKWVYDKLCSAVRTSQGLSYYDGAGHRILARQLGFDEYGSQNVQQLIRTILAEWTTSGRLEIREVDLDASVEAA